MQFLRISPNFLQLHLRKNSPFSFTETIKMGATDNAIEICAYLIKCMLGIHNNVSKST